MQSLPSYLVPATLLVLLSIVSCSSKTETNQKGARLIDDSSVTIDSSSGLLEDATNSSSNSTINVSANVLANNGESDASDSVTQTGSSQSDVGAADAGLNLNSTNYEQIAKSAVQVINMIELDRERVGARALLSQLNASGWNVIDGESGLPGLTLASQESVLGEYDQGDYSQIFTCDEGGSLSVALKDFSQGPFYHYRTSFENCQWNGQTHNGSLESSGARRAPDRTIFRDYTRTSASQSITITGEHEHSLAFFGNPESNIWTDTSFVVTNIAGTVKVDSINWSTEAADAVHLDAAQGFVLRPDGTVKRVAQYHHAANLQATFSFTPAQLQTDAMTVKVSLGYETHYFNWEGHYESGFDLPTSPVSDLGTSIDVYSDFDVYASTSQLFDSLPKDLTPQWQSGEISITAPDTTSLVIKPDSNNTAAVLIELNGSGEQVSKLWADGYQVSCPSSFGVCGLAQ